MNIQQAKEEIKRTYRAYMEKDENGRSCIPPEQQRPVLMIGPPGIGKTAIMRQIAEETGCGLLSYTMTHHTRQSAIGLPFISKRVYDGREYSITEYTMSEIVAAMYDYMEETGKKSGILFLDEINCVSETLTPVMLQLLQNKTFGNHRLPKNWLIVAAGNPPEYNKSVRELDMVTMDRVRHMEIEADLSVWMDYAQKREVHPAVRTYLTTCPDHFYRIDNTEGGQEFATARGWEDFSSMLYSYEKNGEEIEDGFFLEYIQHREIAHSFSVYYDLFRHYMAKGAEDLAQGLLTDPEKLAQIPSTGCLAVSALLFHQIQTEAQTCARKAKELKRLNELIGLIQKDADFGNTDTAREFFDSKKEAVRIREEHGVTTPIQSLEELGILRRMESDYAGWLKADKEEGFPAYEQKRSDAENAILEQAEASVITKTENAYTVLEACAQGQSSILYLTADLSRDEGTQLILKDRDCPIYKKWYNEVFAEESDLESEK